MKKCIFLPIEIKRREFLAKLNLAIRLCDCNYQVVLGYQDEEVFFRGLPGFYLLKDHAYSSESRIQRIASDRDGIYISALDEEGLITEERAYVNHRGSKSLLDSMSAVFLWGKEQLDLVSRISDKKENKYIVGGLSFDIYSKLANLKANINKKSKNGPVRILINTRFPYINGFRGGGEVEVLKHVGLLKNESDMQILHSRIKDDALIFKEFDKLVKALANDDRFFLTIRPHPAEDAELYREYEKIGSNILVRDDVRLVDQILSNDCVVHDGCTTAIEAVALGVPALGLRPEGLSVHAYNPYANKFSINFHNADELFNYFVEKAGSQNWEKEFVPGIDEYALQRIANWKNIEKNCGDSILNVVNDISIRPIAIVRKSSSAFLRTLYHFPKYFLIYLMANSKMVRHLCSFMLGKNRVNRAIISRYSSRKKLISDVKFERLTLSFVLGEIEYRDVCRP
ncbi:MAG: hypothetical protein P1V33_04150 [Pseudohongiella nitratireducens]|nr:hypothetical protein [Pseudohongiella nitratireducens]